MRIVHVMPGTGLGGGAERSFLVTAAGLIERGHELHLAALTERRDGVEQVEAAGVHVHDLSGHHTIVGRARAIRGLARRLRPDVVQASLHFCTEPTQLGMRGTGIPVLVTWTALPYSAERRHEAGVSGWRLDAVRRTEALLARWCPSDYQAVTEGVGRSYGRSIGVPRERIHVAERGRAPAPPRDGARRRATRHALGIGDDDRLVLALARHEPRKGLDRAVEGFDRVVDAVPGAHLVVAGGEGPSTDALLRARGAAAHPERVHLLGHRDDVAALLEAADAFALTSLSEGASGAVIEAFSHGLPVVSARLEGLEGVLVDGVNARVVDPGTPDAFADALVEVLSDPALAARLGAAGSATYEERFTVERSVDALEALYRQVAARGR